MSNMDNNANKSTAINWRTSQALEPRQKIVKRIMDTLLKHMPPRGQRNIHEQELLKIARRFEEKIFQAATDERDYLRRISLKMLALEANAQAEFSSDPQARPVNPPSGALQHNAGAAVPVEDQGQEEVLANRIEVNEPFSGHSQQRQQQTASQSHPNNVNANAMEYLASSLPDMTGMPQNDFLAMATAASNIFQQTTKQREQEQIQSRQQQQQQFLPPPQQPPRQQPRGTHHQHHQQAFPQQHQQQHDLQQQVQPLPHHQKQQVPNQQLSSRPANVPLILQRQQKKLMQAQLLQQRKQHAQQQSQQQKQAQQVPSIVHSEFQQPQQSQQPNPSQELSQQQEQLQQLQSTSQQPRSHAYQQRPQQPDSSNRSRAVTLDHQEAVWLKLQVLKEKYEHDLKELYDVLVKWSKQTMTPEQLQKVNHHKDLIYRLIPYLLVSKRKIPPEFDQEKVKSLEARITRIIENYKRHKANQSQRAEVTTAGQIQLQPDQISHPLQQQQELPAQMQLQNNKPMELPGNSSAQAPASTAHFSGLSTGVTAPQGVSSLQQPSAQFHPIGLQMNSSQQSLITSSQPGGVNTMPLNALMLQLNPGISSMQSGTNASHQNGTLQQRHSSHLQQQDEKLKDQNLAKQQSQQRQFPLPQQEPQREPQREPQQELLHQQQKKVQLHPRAQQTPQLQDLSEFKENASRATQVAVKQVLLQQKKMKQQQQAQQLKLISHQASANVVPSPQAAAPPLKIPSPSTIPASLSSIHEEVELESDTPATFVFTPGSVQTVQSPIPTPNSMLAVGAPETCVFTVTPDYPPSPAVIAAPQDNIQVSSPNPDMPAADLDIDPIERLTTKIDVISVKALNSAAEEMNAIISCSIKFGASAPGDGSIVTVAEDLVSVTNLRLQADALMNEDNNPPKKKLRHFHSVPFTIVTPDRTAVDTLGTASMMKAHIKNSQLKVPQVVQEEITHINDILIDTEVDVSEEVTLEAVAAGQEGVVVSCLYKAVSVSPTLKRSMMVSTLPCVWLIIPPSYPHSSPVIWSKRMVSDSSANIESTAHNRFAREVRLLTTPVSLKNMALCWDRCARQALTDAVVVHGGGTFSTSMGVWDAWE